MISLGIDIGTTSICAVLYDLTEDKIIRNVSAPNSFVNTGSYLQDPDRIVSVVKELYKELMMELKLWTGERETRKGVVLAGVGISSQMHGILYTDSMGKAVTPLYTWKNEDGNKEYRDGLTYACYLAKETGLPFYTGYGSVTHFYLQETGQIPDNAAAFVGIGDYLAMQLTGSRKAVVHKTMAVSFGGCHLEDGRFELEKLLAAGVDISYYPAVAGAKDLTAGSMKLESETDLTGGDRVAPESIPVLYAVGDNQASFLGAVRDQEHAVSINVGTGSQVSVYSKDFYPEAGIDIRPWIEDGYLYVGASLNGGKVYERLAAFFEEVCEKFTGQKIDAYKAMERLAMEEKETKLRAVPTLYGSRKETESGQEAGIYGLNPDNFHPEDFIRSFTAGMAHELFSLYSTFPDMVCAGKTQIVASGNGIRKNSLLREDVERVFGLPVIFTDREEEAASGAALYVRRAVIEGGAECR